MHKIQNRTKQKILKISFKHSVLLKSEHETNHFKNKNNLKIKILKIKHIIMILQQLKNDISRKILLHVFVHCTLFQLYSH